jgi:DNA (cytosine-5)-methyltransferase 1
MLRAIQEIKPKYVIAENVFGITNIDGGLVFEQVCLDLENEGYEVQPFIIPAAAKNAPHRRDRCWFVAYANGTKQRNNPGTNNAEKGEIWGDEKGDVSREFCGDGNVTDTSSGGIQGYGGRGKNGEFQTNEFNENNSKRQPRMDWEKFPTQSPICGGDDGLPTELDGITFSKWRNESIKAYGNAIVPQVAYEIFKVLQHIDDSLK